MIRVLEKGKKNSMTLVGLFLTEKKLLFQLKIIHVTMVSFHIYTPLCMNILIYS
jgi:hypothetical protein